MANQSGEGGPARVGIVVGSRSDIAAADKAAAVLDDTDKMRARYTREYYRRDWSDPVNFHMVLNTGVLGFDGATAVVVGRARAMGW